MALLALLTMLHVKKTHRFTGILGIPKHGVTLNLLSFTPTRYPSILQGPEGRG